MLTDTPATQLDILALRLEIARAKADALKWVLAVAMAVEAIVIVGAIIALSRVTH